MNIIYTIGFTKKTLKDFVTRLRNAGVQRVVDIRLNNSSQLAGFAKSSDLEFILDQFGIEYISVKELAPDEALLSKYRKDKNWSEYEINFKVLMESRNARKILSGLQLDKKVSCLLCSEDRADKCHRRLIAEMIGGRVGNYSSVIKFVDLTFIDEPLSIVKFVREKMLVMGIAEPHKSRKYEVAVCVAGITTQDKFSRSNIDFPSYHVASPDVWRLA